MFPVQHLRLMEHCRWRDEVKNDKPNFDTFLQVLHRHVCRQAPKFGLLRKNLNFSKAFNIFQLKATLTVNPFYLFVFYQVIVL